MFYMHSRGHSVTASALPSLRGPPQPRTVLAPVPAQLWRWVCGKRHSHRFCTYTRAPCPKLTFLPDGSITCSKSVFEAGLPVAPGGVLCVRGHPSQAPRDARELDGQRYV